MVEPWALRAFPARSARLARLIADNRLYALLLQSFGITGWSVAAPGRFDAATPGIVELRRGDETAQIVVDLSDWPALASTALAAANRGAAADAQLGAAVASILLSPVCDALAALGLDGVQVSAVRTGTPRGDQLLQPLSLRQGERTLRFGVLEAAEGWLDLIEQLIAEQCLPFTPRVSQLAVPGRLQLGARALSIATLESLRPGDVVLHAVRHPREAFFSDGAEPLHAPLIWGHPGRRQLRCMARVDPHTLTLTGTPLMTYDTHDDDLAPAQPGEAPVSISDLDLPVKIEIDTVSLPVAQLSALRAGYVIELPQPVRDAQVRLVAYGQTVGFGELVAVGEHIGVRIVRMSSHRDPVQ